MNIQTINELVALNTVRNPEKIVLRHKQRTITYRLLAEQSKALGCYLQQLSAVRGERVGILIDKSIEQVISLLGILAADKVFVIINSALHENQIKHILCDCNVQYLISDKKFDKYLEKIIGLTEVKKTIYQDQFAAIFQEYLGRAPQCSAAPDDIANIIYTSGSTGLPKGIVLTHRNLVEGARIVSGYLHISKDEKILALLPFNFDYGLNQLLSTLYCGCELVLFQYFMPNELLKILEEEKITGLAAIPPVWAGVFNNKLCDIERKKYDLSSLRYITNSGGKIPVPSVKKIRAAFPKTDLYLMYGLTEAFRSTFLDPQEVDRRPDSMGKAIPDVEVEVVDGEGRPCPPDVEGELIHMGACIAKGYWNDPKKTAEVYRPCPLPGREGEICVYSGDLVKKDKEGFLYFISRKDNMIKTAGYRVSPTEVEELLLGLKGVTEAVVFGLEDPELGYKIRAVITLDRELTTPEIIQYCKANAPAYLVPQEIFVVPAFPKTASGKVDRPRVKRESLEQHGK